MLESYRAVVKGGQIKWLGSAPTDQDLPLEVDVTVRGRHVPNPGSGVAMADALEELAKINAFKGIQDPVAWQREMRRDKPLLRDEGQR